MRIGLRRVAERPGIRCSAAHPLTVPTYAALMSTFLVSCPIAYLQGASRSALGPGAVFRPPQPLNSKSDPNEPSQLSRF